MAYGRKTGGRDFQPGNNANPIGRNAHNERLKAIKRMTKDELADIMQMLLEGKIAEIENYIYDSEAPMLRKYMASVIIKAMERGDMGPLNHMFDRIVGKVKEELEVQQSVPFVLTYRNGEKMIIGPSKEVVEDLFQEREEGNGPDESTN